MNDLLDQIDRKIESAKSKFIPAFGNDKQDVPKPKPKEFSVIPESDEKPTLELKQRFSAGKSIVKTPATVDVSAITATANEKTVDQSKEIDFTPTQFARYDEQGNRNSILPGSARPSSTQRLSRNASSGDKMQGPSDFPGIQEEDDEPKKLAKKPAVKRSASVKPKSVELDRAPQQRQNFVKINTNKNFQQRSRGEVFSNKILAKKRNAMKFKTRNF